ncbi:glycosyltransferase [Candidatus Nanohalobium constans]|uniref:Dolichol-phosphate mannosyltransferase n=1 Tax=Candidatus Nanohalobium constans TaxID=2565781 RepID=A0A5Q0UEU8_9ARCH|nr:glycosyltransferase family 2 protein [Candidatus Nanohalobium constans]QGA80112.1 dolichol-phosphate mannosyltransferase [Candidatus Nanohalobium constans]
MISVITPTYNEKKNLEQLFHKVDNALNHRDYEILLVDDDSPDGTAEKAEELSQDYPVNVFVREKDHGLSQSVIKGFEEAKGDQIVVMDADLQHPPEKIPELIQKLSGSDIAVGSRFKEKDSVEHWKLSRKIINRGAAIPAKIVMYPMRLSDPMSGFFAFNKDAVDSENLDPEGFKILLEILHCNDLDIEEVQFSFGERKSGDSKLGLAEIVEYMEHVGSILFNRLGLTRPQSKRLVNAAEFMGVGATGVLVNSVIFLAAIQNNFHYSIAGGLAFLGALQWNFFWNREITFSKSTKSFKHQYTYFFLVNLGGFAIYEILLFVLIGLLNVWEPAANIAAIFGGFLLNFFGSEKLAFE